MNVTQNHITVCICTFKRPQLLKHLLTELARQDTGGQFSFSIVVVDNDRQGSAESVTAEFATSSQIQISYHVETRQNIPLARNKAVENASGNFIAFIDDDEFPNERWLLTLFTACRQYGVDGVLGPVKPHFAANAPAWVVKGKFYERESYPTGLIIDWRKGRTGNVLLKREIFAKSPVPFNPEFRQGEDQEFFHRMIKEGHVFIWCDEAVAYEAVPPIRWKRSFMLRRALLRGVIEPKTPDFGIRQLLKSIIAVPVYALALPFAVLAGHHRFMGLLVRLCDHLGKLFGAVGINPITEPYVTE